MKKSEWKICEEKKEILKKWDVKKLILMRKKREKWDDK